MQGLFLKEVTIADAEMLLNWRNEKTVRENSFHSEIIPYETHVAWLEQKLADPDEGLWILSCEEGPAGQIRLSKDTEGVEISYSVDAGFRGRGYGKAIIRLGEEVLEKQGYCGKITALVKKENIVSQKVFRNLGYREEEKQDFFEYSKILPQTIYIRADMNPTIATGHMMRCLSIADAAAKMGKKTVFITADEYPSELIKQRGYENIVLGTDWQNMEAELPKLTAVIREQGIQKLLLDSYQVTQRYMSDLKAEVELVYLDDLDAFEYPVDRLICYANYFGSFSYGKKEEKDGFYLGMKYVPLRSVFQNCSQKTIKDRIEKLLLLSGGSDSHGIIERMVDVFKDNTEVTLTVVCGSFYKNYGQLVEKYKEYPNLIFRQNVPNLEDYMKEADLAISAGGTTLYELCALGTPAISYSFADNQLFNVEQFAKDGLIDYAGDVRTDNIFKNVSVLFEKNNSDKRLREDRSVRMQQMVDGKGAQRIAKVIL